MSSFWFLVYTYPLFGLAVCLGVTYLLIQIIQLYFLLTYQAQFEPEPQEWPEISIWVAARNEADNIADCLDALIHLDYPKDKLQILVGNDQSSDNTGEIAREWSQRHPQIKVIEIIDNNSGLKAKARVMAQLDVHAKGEYYLITDADVRVKPEWAKFMIRSLPNHVGVASGTTMVKSQPNYRGWDRIWAHLQGIDWTYFMGLLNAISYAGVPATAVGNNMIVRKKAYWETGGYANIRFSITEDYKLYSEICNKGYGWNNVMSPQVLAHSVETKGFGSLLHQRKRWLSGGKELPWYWWLLFGVFGLFYLAIPIQLLVLSALKLLSNTFHFPFSTMIEIIGLIWILKWLIQCAQITTIEKKVREKTTKGFWHFLYEGYLTLLTLGTATFFFLPQKTIWKGRKY
jgi:cellulose synthase/poly-beta-1,6-N-acetylglucosamine synthase-like glycosyltransferase